MALVFHSCKKNANPPMPGFNAKDSDPKAIEIADRVMEKLGGRKNWDNTRYITWNFFGRRMHVWDKWTGNLRIEYKDQVILMNLNTRKGRAWKAGREITDPDSLQKVLDMGYRAWVNDSYWMFMPYKLKDTGVTLKYLGEGKMENGDQADILQLTFANVGVTPENKYHIYVDKKTGLVRQWAYFRKATDDKPAFVVPWNNWQRYGNILLSDDRGRGKHTNIAVFDHLPDSVFTDPAPFNLSEYTAK
ncbi:MAG: hypothetical protein D6814_05855 [Calditrichaeota bacterium]|nr:MAG: hypothetical protein D6814_05855 [Calditrichota bacterium]